MPGTKTSGRPGGNPDLWKHGFKCVGEKRMDGALSIRIDKSDMEALRKIPNWSNLVREKISEIIKGEG